MPSITEAKAKWLGTSGKRDLANKKDLDEAADSFMSKK